MSLPDPKPTNVGVVESLPPADSRHVIGFDMLHDVAIANRKALLERAVTDKIKLLGFRWSDPGVGYAERKDNACRFVPAT